MNSQESTTDQLLRAIALCEREGLYDAADWIKEALRRMAFTGWR